MDDDEIVAGLERVLRAVYDDPALVVIPDLPCERLPAWDSLIRVTVAIELEGEFRVRIASQQMEDVATLGDIAALVRAARLHGGAHASEATPGPTIVPPPGQRLGHAV